jgi:hypothetical protein
MNCSDFKKRIYLYRELTPIEKKLTDEHIAYCESCSELATRVFQEQALIRKFSRKNFEVNDPQRLTMRIMNSIEKKEQRVGWVDGVVTFPDSIFVRYAFSGASLLLVIFFLYEQAGIDQINSAPEVAKTEIKPGPVLDMNLFLDTYRKHRVNKEPAPISRYAYYKAVRSVKTYNQ